MTTTHENKHPQRAISVRCGKYAGTKGFPFCCGDRNRSNPRALLRRTEIGVTNPRQVYKNHD